MTKAINLFREKNGSGGGGTSNYDELSNRPKINDTTLTGNKSAGQLGLATPIPVVDISLGQPNMIEPDKVFLMGTLAGDTVFPELIPVSDGYAHIYCWTFSTPATAPTITWPSGITGWAGGSAPTINASKNYEVSVMDGLACIVES